MKVFSVLFFLTFTISAWAQEFGRASYYADSFQGLKTASGEAYDNRELTASHNTYPFGTLVKVTRLDNKSSVIVRINDRGPFIKGRIVDVSKRAAQKLGMIEDGEVEVKIEVVGKKDQTPEPVAVNNRTTRPKGGTPDPVAVTPATTYDSSEPRRTREKTKAPPVAATRSVEDREVRSANGSIQTAEMLRSNYTKYGLYKIKLMKPERTGFGVQVGSYSSYDNVMQQVATLQAKWFDDILVSIEPGAGAQPSYKVILGQFATEDMAESYKKDLKSKHRINGFVVNLQTP